MTWESGDCAMCSRAAARPKCSSSPTATNACSWRISTRRDYALLALNRRLIGPICRKGRRTVRRVDPIPTREEESNGRRRNLGTVTPMTGDEYPRVHPGRPGDLGLRRARQGRHDAPGVPQRGADGRPPLRRAARPRPRDVLTDARPTPAAAASRTRSSAPPHSAEDLVADRDAIAAWAADDATAGWAARPTTRPRSSARSAPTPSSTTRTRTTRGAGTRRRRSGASTGTTRSSTRRSTASAAADEVARRLRARGEGDRRGPRRQRREGRRHRLGAHPLQLHRPLRASPIKTKEFALVFTVPMDAPGVKLICRPSYALARPR